MNVTSCLPVSDADAATELTGALNGAAWFQGMRRLIDAADPGLHALDFAGVRLATVSWLREAVLALVKYAAALRPDLLLIAANATDLVKEELSVALEATSSVIIAADVSTSLKVLQPVLLGRLDTALDETLRAILGRNECDASFLSQALPPLGLSAANNRLAALESRGVLTSERRGRSRIYRPVMEGLRYGN